MPPPSRAALLAGHQAAVAQVRGRILAFSKVLWAGQPAYRDADVDRMVKLIVPRVQAGQLQVAALTAAYIARAAGIPPVPVVRAEVLNGRGVPADEVYRRPAVTVYRSLAGGASYSAAVQAGAARLASTAATDLQMAKVRQARNSMRSGGIDTYARVVSGKTCALCYVAATQIYYKEDLSPIHPGCDCGVDPITADRPWDQGAMDKQLQDTHAAVDDFLGVSDPGARTPDYRKLVATREHGEFGPTLVRAGDHFDGPSVVN